MLRVFGPLPPRIWTNIDADPLLQTFSLLCIDGCQYLPGTGTPASFLSTDLLDSWLPKVLEQLRFRGLPLSPSLYEEAIAACATGDQQKEARRLLGKMIAAGYEPSKHLGQKQVGLRYGRVVG